MAEPEPAGGQAGSAAVARVILVLTAVAIGTWLGLACGDHTLCDVRAVVLVLLTVPSVLGLCATLATWRLSGRRARQSGRSLVSPLVLAWLLGPPLGALFPLATWLPAWGLALDLFGSFGVLIALSIPILLPITLVRQWRELEIAEALIGGECRINVEKMPATATPPPGESASAPVRP